MNTTRIFLATGWKSSDILRAQELWKLGVDVGLCLNPYYTSKNLIDLAACTGLPIMVDNGAYQAWKSGTEPDWDKAVALAEELNAEYIVALDKIGDPEESLGLSLEVFGSTDVEKIVPFHAITLGPNNQRQIKRHLRLMIDNGVRVVGMPLPASDACGHKAFAISCMWIVPTRCHALGFTFDEKYMNSFKYFDSVDSSARWVENRKADAEGIRDYVIQSLKPEDRIEDARKWFSVN